MKSHRFILAILFLLCCTFYIYAQTGSSANQPAANDRDSQAEEELQTGIRLTHDGRFIDAIPHLLVAQGRVSDEYAAKFDLSLCYVATGQFKAAISILDDLRRTGHDNADVNNLLAQAYVGDGRDEKAVQALSRATNLSPTNEKLYLFVVDACTSRQNYALGLKVADMGLKNLPQSPRLHYDRAMSLTQLDEFDAAKTDFDLAAKLGAGTGIAYMAAAQKELHEGNVAEAIRIAREGVTKFYDDPILLSMLGDALIRSGVAPGQPEFAEAETVLEKSVAAKPSYAGSQINLGKLYLMENRLDQAIAHLEIGGRLDPSSPSVYSNLAVAYKKRGDIQQAKYALATLARLNQAQAERIRTAPGDHKASY